MYSIPVAVWQPVAVTLGWAPVPARGSPVAPAAAAAPGAGRPSGARSGAGSSPGSGAGLEAPPAGAAAAVGAAGWRAGTPWGRWRAAGARAAAAAACAGWPRSAPGGPWRGRTAAGSASAPSAAPSAEWEASLLQGKRKHAGEIKTSKCPMLSVDLRRKSTANRVVLLLTLPQDTIT